VAISFKDFGSPDFSIANQRDWAAEATELRRWLYGGGKVLPGLVCRRVAEAKLLDL